MNKGQAALTGLVALVAVELLPVCIVATRVLADGVEVTYEVENEKELDKLESEMAKAERVAEKDMKEAE